MNKVCRVLVSACWVLGVSHGLMAQSKKPETLHLYDQNRIQEIKITFFQADWSKKLDSLKRKDSDDRLLARVSVNGVSYDSVGIRYKGNSSFYNTSNKGEDKLPFNLKFNYVKKQVLPGEYTTLKLSNHFRDPTFVREMLAYEIANTYLFAPRSAFAKLYINDAYFGLYQSTESIDNRFLDKRFGEHKGVLVKVDPVWDAPRPATCPTHNLGSLYYMGADVTCYDRFYDVEGKGGWDSLINLCREVSQPTAKLEKTFDIDQTLWMLAFDNVFVNLDSYIGAFCHNYYLYQDSTGYWTPLIWDLNLCFGGFRIADKDPLDIKQMQELSAMVHLREHPGERPLIGLLETDLYRKIYLAHINTILEDFVLNGKYLELARQYQRQIQTAVEQDTNKLYPLDTYFESLNNTVRLDKIEIPGLQELMEGRAAYFKNHPLWTKSRPVIAGHTLEKQSEAQKIKVTASETEAVYLFSRPAGTRVYTRVAMNKAGETAWEVSVPKGHVEYYLVAENKIWARTLPDRSGKEFLTIK